MSAELHIDREDPEVAVFTLNRPDKRNALSIDLMRTLIEEIEKTHADRKKRVLVLKGEGSCFCTGLDLKEAGDMSLAEESANLIARLLNSLYQSPLITLSVVQGYAIAGGAGLAAVSDYVLAEEGVKIGFPEVQRGLVPAIVFAFLHRQVQEKDLRELFLFGDLVEAKRAKEIGLINRIVKEDQLDSALQEQISKALQGGPETITHLKRLFHQLYPKPIEEDLSVTLSFHKLARTHREAKEGIAAFNEKRKPKWCR